MKRKLWVILLLVVAAVMTACGGSSQGTDTEQEENEFKYKEAGIGDLKLKLHEDWKYEEEQCNDNSLAFSKGNSILGVSFSKEGAYQTPLDMADRVEMNYSSFEDYKEIMEPKLIEVNGETWCEMEFSFKEDGNDVTVYERCYGKNYNAYAVSFTAFSEEYEEDIEEAKMIMDTVTMNVADYDETAAREFFVGEWGVGDGGLLILNEDGTYQWFMDAESRDPAYMHEGTYGCDDEIKSMGTEKGSGSYYLCLIPEHFYNEGKEVEMSAHIYNFAVSHESTANDNVYQMINISTMGIYTIIKIDPAAKES